MIPDLPYRREEFPSIAAIEAWIETGNLCYYLMQNDDDHKTDQTPHEPPSDSDKEI